MKMAGQLVGRSASYIAHVETGRMDAPKSENLERLLEAYGGMKPKSFRERVRLHNKKRDPKEELIQLVNLANAEQTRTLLRIVTGILA